MTSEGLPEDVLRQAFEARAEQVQISPDALESIRDRVGRRRAHLGPALLASVATVAAVFVGLISCLPTPSPSPQPPAVTPSLSASLAPNARLPVYFVGAVAGKPLLYREFHSSAVPVDTLPARIEEAVRLVLSGRPLDPDYASSWPPGSSVREVALDGGVALVDLAGATASTPPSPEMAVQQLVWTVTAVAADRGVQLEGVRLLFDGAPLGTLWGSVDVAGPLTRAPALDTLAPVWLISPQEGDTVESTFDTHLSGAVFEATAGLRARDSSGAIVEDKAVTLSIAAPSRGEAHVSMRLPPGTYTLEAFTVSPVDGSIQALDTHTITVR